MWQRAGRRCRGVGTRPPSPARPCANVQTPAAVPRQGLGVAAAQSVKWQQGDSWSGGQRCSGSGFGTSHSVPSAHTGQANLSRRPLLCSRAPPGAGSDPWGEAEHSPEIWTPPLGFPLPGGECVTHNPTTSERVRPTVRVWGVPQRQSGRSRAGVSTQHLTKDARPTRQGCLRWCCGPLERAAVTSSPATSCGLSYSSVLRCRARVSPLTSWCRAAPQWLSGTPLQIFIYIERR